MVHSLTHLAVLAIPTDTFIKEEKPRLVLWNVEWEAVCLLSKKKKELIELNEELEENRYNYYDKISPTGTGPHPKSQVIDDMTIATEELAADYDHMIEYRNEISTHRLWSRQFVYMDWIMGKCFCCPLRRMEFEELYHMLKGSVISWTTLSPTFDTSKYTSTELEMHSLLTGYQRMCARHFKTLERHQTASFEDIWKYGKGLEDASQKIDECERIIKFYKSVIYNIARVAPRYGFRNHLELQLFADQTFE